MQQKLSFNPKKIMNIFNVNAIFSILFVFKYQTQKTIFRNGDLDNILFLWKIRTQNLKRLASDPKTPD